VNAGESEPTGDPPPLDTDGETVVCRHCGAANRTGYQYCRWCVRSGFVDDGSDGTAGGGDDEPVAVNQSASTRHPPE